MKNIKPIMPKEHGMWAWVLLPLAVGGSTVRGDMHGFIPFFFAVFFWFLTFTPVRIIYKNSKRKLEQPKNVTAWCVIYSLPALFFTAYSFFYDIRMLFVYILFSPLFYIGVRASHAGFHRSFAFEFGGIMALSLLCPLAWFSVTGEFSQISLGVWSLTALFLLDRNLQARNSVKGIDWFSGEPRTTEAMRLVFKINIFIAITAIFGASMLLTLFSLKKVLMTLFLPSLLASTVFYIAPPSGIRVLGWMEVLLAVSFGLIFSYISPALH